jgi:hypothetical protein
MTTAPARPASGRAAPVLVLCRQCVQYVFAGTETCPHCGRDARETGPRYREGPYAAIEAIERIETSLARRSEARAIPRDDENNE